MASALFFDLVYALGVAISPTPVILVILMLFGVRGHMNALGYLLGWIIGLVVLGVLIFALVTAGIIFLNAESGIFRPSVQVLLAFVLFWVAHRQWTKPVHADPDTDGPKWMGSVDKILSRTDNAIAPERAFFLAIVMSAISPKNIALMIAAVLAFSQTDLETQDIVLLFVLFVVISSLTIGIPVAYALLKGDKAVESLNNWKVWLLTNSPRAAAILVGMLGLVMLLNGLSGLSMKFAM